jgi:GNAT superfamily N-acetyltransferase
MAGELRLVELSRDRAGLRRFLRVPYDVYRNDPRWVAPLLSDRGKVLGPENPFFSHARIALWTITRDGRDVGRVAGIVDEHHNRRRRETTAFFGFFESADDPAVGRLLLGAVRGWASRLGMTRLLGPMNPSINEECGLLVEGFDSPPVIMTTYNPAYYGRLLEAVGLRRCKDLVAYLAVLDDTRLARLDRLAARALREVTIRPVVRRALLRELPKIQDVYNAAWEDNWGHVPMTADEVAFMARRLLPLLDENLALVAESGDTAVGFILILPDFNEPLGRLRGRLLSPRLPLILPYLAGLRRPRAVRVIAMGIRREFRTRGIDAALIAASVRAGLRRGYERCEISWILEDNLRARRLAELLEGSVYKRHALYEGEIEERRSPHS